MATLISSHPSIPSLRSHHSASRSTDMSYDYPAPRPSFSQGIRRASSDHDLDANRARRMIDGPERPFVGEGGRRGSTSSTGGGGGRDSPRGGQQIFLPASQSYPYQYPSSSSTNSSPRTPQFALPPSQSHPPANPWSGGIAQHPGFFPGQFATPLPGQQQFFSPSPTHPNPQMHAQAQANFAAWAAAYQGMMIAAQQQQQQQGSPTMHHPGLQMYPNNGAVGNSISRSVTAPPKLQIGAAPFVPLAQQQQQQPRSAGAGGPPGAAAFHPYRRGQVGGKKERERDRVERGERGERDASTGSSVAGSSVSGNSASSAVAAPKSTTPAKSLLLEGGLGKFDFEEPSFSSEPDQMTETIDETPVPPQAAFTKVGRTSSNDSMRSNSAQRPVPARARTDSTSSVVSAGGTRTGRIPVPPLLGVPEGLKRSEQGIQEDAFGGGAHGKPKERIETEDKANQTLSSGTPTHTRQSSSTSSVGAIIKPSLAESANGGPSGWKPSPLSQAQPAPAASPERAPASVPSVPSTPEAAKAPEKKEKEKTGGFLRGKLQKALKSDSSKDKEEKARLAAAAKAADKPLPAPGTDSPTAPRQAERSVSGSSSAPEQGMLASASLPAILPQHAMSPPSQSSATSSTPPATPPSTNGTVPPHQRLGNRTASNSSFQPSLIEPLGGQAKGKGKSLFNLKNASTDNISISSTVSSASMMIRKMGALGKLARRNSLAGISKIFKDKPKEAEDGVLVDDKDNKDKKKKEKKKGLFSSKSPASPSRTSLATAESFDEDRALAGLSPAAKLARQHTLRSKSDDGSKDDVAKGPSWDNKELRPGQAAALPALGSVIPAGAFASTVASTSYDEDDLDDSDDESEMGETIDEGTPRLDGLGPDDSRASMDSYQNGYTWGMTYRDRHAIPARGILKSVSSYPGDVEFQAPAAPWSARTRSNYSTQSSGPQEPGPLAHVASENIDGIPPAKHVTMDPIISPSPATFDPTPTEREPLAERINFPYANASLNTSAPALSAANNLGLMSKRAATAPLQKRSLVWAPECAVYHTFHPTEYDRRSEPATCNRLTPQLAQQIKDELNGYKMEEMDVHPSSRIHTHFFV